MLRDYESNEIGIKPLRQKHLSSNVLFVLFDEKVRCVEIKMKREKLHFGVSEPDDWHPNPYKRIRDTQGEETAVVHDVPFRNGTGESVIEIGALADKLISSPNSALLGLQLIAGVERVRFNQV